MTATPTEQKPRRGHKRLSPELVTKLREEFAKGASAQELAKKFDINVTTILSRVDRDGWTQRRREVSALVAKTAAQYAAKVAQDMAEEAAHLTLQVINDTKVMMQRIREMINQKDLKAKDCPDLVSAYKSAVGLQRQALGLSDESVPTGPKPVISNNLIITQSTVGEHVAKVGEIQTVKPVELPPVDV